MRAGVSKVINGTDHATSKNLFDLESGIEPYLPDSVIPIWNFLQDYPALLVLLLVTLGYVVGKLSSGCYALVWSELRNGQAPPWTINWSSA